MVLFSLYLREDQLATLRGLSLTTGAPVAWFIRRGVDWALGSGLPCVASGHIAQGLVFLSGGLN